LDKQSNITLVTVDVEDENNQEEIEEAEDSPPPTPLGFEPGLVGKLDRELLM